MMQARYRTSAKGIGLERLQRTSFFCPALDDC